MDIVPIEDVSDCKPFYKTNDLYLKPYAKFHISVSFPIGGDRKNLTVKGVMKKLRELILPHKYVLLNNTICSTNRMRFIAEIENRTQLKGVLQMLNRNEVEFKEANSSCTAKLHAFKWLDETPTLSEFDDKKGKKNVAERPDTLYISNLPIRWFCPKCNKNDDVVQPNEKILKYIFRKYGYIKDMDIPICDPYRIKMHPNLIGKSNPFDQELYFDMYIRYETTGGLIKLLEDFRGMKLVNQDDDNGNFSVFINIEIDASQHLNAERIQKRVTVREQLAAEAKKNENIQLANEQQKSKKESGSKQTSILERDNQKEREKEFKKLYEKDQLEIDEKIREEEKYLLIAQRQLESFRILGALFDRIKIKSVNATNGYYNSSPPYREPSVETLSSNDSIFNDKKKKRKNKKHKQVINVNGGGAVAMNNITPFGAPPFPLYDPWMMQAQVQAQVQAQAQAYWMNQAMYPVMPSYQTYESHQTFYPDAMGNDEWTGPHSGSYQQQQQQQQHFDGDVLGYQPPPSSYRGRGGYARGRSSATSFNNNNKRFNSDSHNNRHYKSYNSRRSRSTSSRRREQRRKNHHRRSSKSSSSSHSQSPSKSTKTKSKLVSTLRSSSSSSGRSSDGWTSKSRNKRSRKNYKQSTWPRSLSPSKASTTTVSKIQENSNEDLLKESLEFVKQLKLKNEHNNNNNIENRKSISPHKIIAEKLPDYDDHRSKSRSKSIDSSTFISPKRYRNNKSSHNQEWDS